MSDTTASHNLPDSGPQANPPNTPVARVALDSAPRQETLPPYSAYPAYPPYAPASNLPLPPPWPSMDHDAARMASAGELPGLSDADGMDGLDAGEMDGDSEGAFPPRRPDDRATRPLFAPEQWVSDPDFWESKTHIALTGRHPVPRPKTIALKPPQRFRPAPRWRSALILLLVCLLIASIALGALEMGRLGTQVFGPTHHTATPVPTHTIAVPTATPKHKK